MTTDVITCTREKIIALEAAMMEMPQLEIETRHTFCNGVYAREITIPKGATVTGRIHLTQHLNIIAQGDISVMTDEGIKRIKAPATIVSSPGTKRVGYAHEDTVWIAILATDMTDADQVEEEFTTNTYADPRLIGIMDSHKEDTPCPLLPQQ